MNLSQDEKNVLYSVVIGDGYITKKDHIVIQHSNKQVDYLTWKKQLVDICLEKHKSRIIEFQRCFSNSEYNLPTRPRQD